MAILLGLSAIACAQFDAALTAAQAKNWRALRPMLNDGHYTQGELDRLISYAAEDALSVRMLLARGASANGFTTSWAPLLGATSAGCHACVKQLLLAGATIPSTVHAIAIERGHRRIAALLEGAMGVDRRAEEEIVLLVFRKRIAAAPRDVVFDLRYDGRALPAAMRGRLDVPRRDGARRLLITVSRLTWADRDHAVVNVATCFSECAATATVQVQRTAGEWRITFDSPLSIS